MFFTIGLFGNYTPFKPTFPHLISWRPIHKRHPPPDPRAWQGEGQGLGWWADPHSASELRAARGAVALRVLWKPCEGGHGCVWSGRADGMRCNLKKDWEKRNRSEQNLYKGLSLITRKQIQLDDTHTHIDIQTKRKKMVTRKQIMVLTRLKEGSYLKTHQDSSATPPNNQA